MKRSTILSFVVPLSLFVVTPRADAALSCTFGSVTGVDFGIYDVFNPSPTRATGTITYSCKKVGGVQYMRMSFSTGSSGSFANRTLRSGGGMMNYNLYPDAVNSRVWGDGTGTTYEYSIDPVDRRPDTLFVYGTIPPGQDVGVGVYTDTITVTMNF